MIRYTVRQCFLQQKERIIWQADPGNSEIKHCQFGCLVIAMPEILLSPIYQSNMSIKFSFQMLLFLGRSRKFIFRSTYYWPVFIRWLLPTWTNLAGGPAAPAAARRPRAPVLTDPARPDPTGLCGALRARLGPAGGRLGAARAPRGKRDCLPVARASDFTT